MMPRFALGILIGYVTHRSRDWVERNFGSGWRQLVSYTLGVCVTYPVAVSAYGELAEIRKARDRFGLAWLLGFGSVGIGTLIGWIFDRK